MLRVIRVSSFLLSSSSYNVIFLSIDLPSSKLQSQCTHAKKSDIFSWEWESKQINNSDNINIRKGTYTLDREIWIWSIFIWINDFMLESLLNNLRKIIQDISHISMILTIFLDIVRIFYGVLSANQHTIWNFDLTEQLNG